MDYTRRRQLQQQQQASELVANETVTREDGEGDLTTLKDAWFPYRALFVPLNKVLEWNPPHFPAVVAGVLTFLFALLWYMEPALLTLLSLSILLAGLLDAFLPVISDRLYSTTAGQWSAEQNAQFERVCVRLSHARSHATHAQAYLLALKRDKPSVFVSVVVSILLLTAWVGSLMDNMLLLYIIVLVALLVPGLRKHGIQQKLTVRISAIFKREGRGARGQ